ncbi:MAG: ABC transporter ATP-binding protein [Candidatus Thorarchaeota archaeon]|nr:ABC transporter ATP-binding protein [Candidatus Thorarchaeota archaeon]
MVDVELKGLVREFDDGSRIGPIDLHVKDGELLTLLGPSGSGKTTTLRMVAGFIENVGGSLLIDGRDMVNVPPRERNIGMVFQSVALFPNMTVFENISFGPDMAGWPREEVIERVEELADLLGVRQLLLRKISEVSGGEAQRVALARALATKPKLLLLDEPLSALDLQLRERLQTEIRRIQRKLKITTIYVTHSQDEAFAISDRVAILDDGVVSQVGTPEELYDSPANEFVASFLGSGNIVSGLITEVSDGNLMVSVKNNRFEIPGDGEVNSQIKFSVKPEDVIISDTPVPDWAQAELVSITPQVGSFKVSLEFNGIPIIALTNDEELVKKLRTNGEKTIAFAFKSESIIIL